jgi:hypothetical protein
MQRRMVVEGWPFALPDQPSCVRVCACVCACVCECAVRACVCVCVCVYAVVCGGAMYAAPIYRL